MRRGGLGASEVAKLRAEARKTVGIRYDSAFEWSDERLYCSELARKLFARALGDTLAPLQRLGDFDLNDPVVRREVHRRFGEHVPLQERVVSPAALLSSKSLTTVVYE